MSVNRYTERFGPDVRNLQLHGRTRLAAAHLAVAKDGQLGVAGNLTFKRATEASPRQCCRHGVQGGADLQKK